LNGSEEENLEETIGPTCPAVKRRACSIYEIGKGYIIEEKDKFLTVL
jgi:hypothetical protein